MFTKFHKAGDKYNSFSQKTQKITLIMQLDIPFN